MSKENVDAKAAEVREKLNDESLDKCKVEGGAYTHAQPSDTSSGGK